MNSEQRHNLQKNELEEAIEDMPEILKKHWMGIGGVILLVIVVLVSWTALKHTIQVNKKKSSQALATIMESRNIAQIDTLSNQVNYNPVAEVTNLGSYANSSTGTPAGYSALLAQANTIMSKIYMSTSYLTAEEKAGICDEAAKVYETVASKYSKYPMAVGLSQVGMAAIAAEARDWDKAESIYNSLIADADKYQGTPVVEMAQYGLSRVADYKKVEPIEFVPAPEPVVEEAAVEPTISPAVSEVITEDNTTAVEPVAVPAEAETPATEN